MRRDEDKRCVVTIDGFDYGIEVKWELAATKPTQIRSRVLSHLDELLERGQAFWVRHQVHPDGKPDDPRPYELLLVVAYPEEGEAG